MALRRVINESVTAPCGFLAAGVKAGIKNLHKEDVAVIFSEHPATAAGVFTTNAFPAAPVLVSREHLVNGTARAVVVNSGCANACTGDQGYADAVAMAAVAAEALHIAPREVVVASTGVIGTYLPMEKVTDGIRRAAAGLSRNDASATMAIMTTDTFPKKIAAEVALSGRPARIGAIAKGAGMIHPNMATMLCFITTDAAVPPEVLRLSLRTAVDRSFNMVTVDGDTSTNDMAVILANGQAGNPPLMAGSADYAAFTNALTNVCVHLAQQIARDGEGATKFLTITVNGAASFADAKQAAMAVANSSLVKTAFFGQDPNWGRILAAVGYSGARVDPARVSLTIGGHGIVAGGRGIGLAPAAIKRVMAEHDIDIIIDLGLGEAAATVWTCDLSYDYVRINGEYTT